jgi:cytochrome c
LGAGASAAQDLSGHGGPVRALALAGDRVYSGSFDTRAIVWEGTAALQVTRAHDGAVTAVQPLADGRFASGGQDGRVAIWGVGAAPERLEQWHDMPVGALAPWRDGVASGGWDGRIVLWDGSGRAVAIEDAHEGQITGLAAWDGGLASVGADARLRIWRGETTETIPLPSPAVALATDDAALFAAGADGVLRRIVPGTEGVAEIALSERPLLAVAAGHGLVAASGTDGQVWLLDADSLEAREVIPSGQRPVWALALTADTLLTGGADGLIRRWSHDGRPLGAGMTPEPTLTGSRGAEVFRACAVCHTLSPDDIPRAGPTLHGIFGRAIATAPDYDYSEALRRLDIVWSPDTVARLFEVGPEAYTPGSRMPEQRIPDPEDRAALIAFLQQMTR